MKVGANVPWFVLRRIFEGDTSKTHVIDDVSIFLQKKFLQRILTNFISFDLKFNAD